MNTTITLDRQDTFSLCAAKDGKTIITIPLEVLKQAYCDYVAGQVSRNVAKPEGTKIQ